MTDARQYLSEEVRHFFGNQCGIRSFYPSQAETFKIGRETDSDIILLVSTDGGKTVAAFGVAGSMSDFGAPGENAGVKILYISPRKALNKDKLEWVEAFAESLGTRVTLWDGDARQGPKNRLVKKPEGILIMNTESLQGMSANHPERLGLLFRNLDFVIIDEIHCFLGTPQGVQLAALLNWIMDEQEKPFRMMGLSATIGGDGSAVKGFLGRAENTVLVKDPAIRPMEVSFEYYPEEEDSKELPEAVIDSIRALSADTKNLVFSNSRGRVEEFTARMRERFGDEVSSHPHYSSLSKQVREQVEYVAKNARGGLDIFCTSTLEHGIDIGDIHRIIQVGPPPGTASLLQRAGRSGRREGTARIVFINTRPEDLLQTLATYRLCARGEIEAPDMSVRWYNEIPHQILSLLKTNTELTAEEVASRISSNKALSFASVEEVGSTIESMVGKEVLAEFEGKLILGPEGERRVKRMDFYAAFNTESTYTVMYEGTRVGNPPCGSIKNPRVGAVFLFNGLSWEITGIDADRAVPILHVKPSTGGKKPTYLSDAPMVGSDVENEMRSILLSDERYDVLGETPTGVIDELRETFRVYDSIGAGCIPCFTDNANRFCLFPFCGTKVFNTLELLLHAQSDGRLLSVNCTRDELIGRSKGILKEPPDLVGILEKMIVDGDLVVTAKNQDLLPPRLQAKMESTLKYDLEGTLAFLHDLVAGSDAPAIPFTAWKLGWTQEKEDWYDAFPDRECK